MKTLSCPSFRYDGVFNNRVLNPGGGVQPMKVDLSKLSLKQLAEHAGQLQDLVKTLKAKECGKILQRWKREDEATMRRRTTEAKRLGLDYADVQRATVPESAGRRRTRRKPRTRKSKGPAKYRDPESDRTWTGRGRVPLWVSGHESGGGKRDDLLIKSPAKPRKARKKSSRKKK